MGASQWKPSILDYRGDHDLFLKPSGYLESLMTTLLALLTNLLVSELCSAGENAVNQAVLGSIVGRDLPRTLDMDRHEQDVCHSDRRHGSGHR